MKTRVPVAILAILVVSAGILYSSAYVVEEGKQVIVTQFGKPVSDVQDAGLHFKAPFVQKAYYLEKRLLPWDGRRKACKRKTRSGSASTSGHAGKSLIR